MAESDEGGGWWGSWYNSAKNKSVEVLEFVKRDLDEFSSAVKNEASNVVTTTTTVFKDKFKLDEPDSTASSMKRSVSSFLGQVSQVLNPSPDDEDEEALVINESEPVQLTKFQILLHALITNPETFLSEPDEAQSQQYKAWRDTVDELLDVDRLTKLLTASPDLHKQYTTLVPDQVSHLLFWERYLFRKALLEDEEAQRDALRRRAEREKQEVENYQWSHDENFGGNVELSEEEQTRLLLEYEKEMEVKRSPSKESRTDNIAIDDNHYSTNREELDNAMKLAVKDEESVDGKQDLSHSSGDKESNDEDWEREFDLSDLNDAGANEQSNTTGETPSIIPTK